MIVTLIAVQANARAQMLPEQVEPPKRGDPLRTLRALDDTGTSLWWRSYVRCPRLAAGWVIMRVLVKVSADEGLMQCAMSTSRQSWCNEKHFVLQEVYGREQLEPIIQTVSMAATLSPASAGPEQAVHHDRPAQG